MAASLRPTTALRAPETPIRSIAPVAPRIATHCDCHYCGSALPRGRTVTFCPYCGQDLTIRQCPACSADLDIGWHFCVSCGRRAEEDPQAAGGGAGG